MLPWCSFQLIVRKTNFTPKDINSFTIQWNAVTDLSKCLPINFTLVPTIQVVCCYQSRSDDHSHFENQVSSHLVIQVSKKRHAHCKWPLIQDSFRCRQTFHAFASRTAPIMKLPAHRRPSAHRRLFTVASRVVTWITWPPLWRSSHSSNSEICIAPEQYSFHSNSARCWGCCRRHWLSMTEIKNIGICKCAALSCPLKLRYSGMLPHLATRVNAHAFWSILIKMHRSSQQPITGKASQDQCSSH